MFLNVAFLFQNKAAKSIRYNKKQLAFTTSAYGLVVPIDACKAAVGSSNQCWAGTDLGGPAGRRRLREGTQGHVFPPGISGAKSRPYVGKVMSKPGLVYFWRRSFFAHAQFPKTDTCRIFGPDPPLVGGPMGAKKTSIKVEIKDFLLPQLPQFPLSIRHLCLLTLPSFSSFFLSIVVFEPVRATLADVATTTPLGHC